jgi:hypothetical protein
VFNLPKNTILGNLQLENTYQFFDVPRLFSCVNRSGCKFLVLSTNDDYDVFEWLYLPISSGRFSSLISKEMTLKKAFITPEDGYLYFVKSDFSGEAEVGHIFPEQIDKEDLPEDQVFLESLEKTSLGLGVVDAKLAAISTQRETCNFHFYPWDTQLPEIDARHLGDILTSFQELANALGQYCEDEVTLKGAIPAGILEASKFRATQIFEGSFGIQLKSKTCSDLFNKSLASDVLLELTNLLESRDNDDNISNKLHELQGRVASKYRRFLKDIVKLESPMKIDWGSPSEDRGGSIKLSKDEIKTAFELVSKIDIDMSESVTFQAELLGLDVATKRYRVKHLTEEEVFAGKIADDSLEKVSHSEINGIYSVTLKKVIETNSSSGAEYTKWLLVELDAANK